MLCVLDGRYKLSLRVALVTTNHHSVSIYSQVRCCTSELPSVVEQSMAPKTTPKKKAADGMCIDKPIVTAADIAKAKDALKDEKAKRRANSNLMYYLQVNGKKDSYDATPHHVRNEFFLAWFADKLKNGETTSSGSKDIGTSREDGREYEWVSKHNLVTSLGNSKAEARIASGKMLTRPDPVTGLSDERNVEYKNFSDVGSEMEKEAQNHRINTETAVESEAAKADLMEDWFAAR